MNIFGLSLFHCLCVPRQPACLNNSTQEKQKRAREITHRKGTHLACIENMSGIFLNLHHAQFTYTTNKYQTACLLASCEEMES